MQDVKHLCRRSQDELPELLSPVQQAYLAGLLTGACISTMAAVMYLMATS